MATKTVSILGCGWLGKPLGAHLHQLGYDVRGSVTSVDKLDSLRGMGIKPAQLVVTETELNCSDPDFFDADVLIISIPPRRIEGIERIFPAQVSHIISSIRNFGIGKVVFISSTSVYPENRQLAKETDIIPPEKSSGKALILSEDLLRNEAGFKTTVIRFGGLIGADRNPARFLLKSGKPVPNNPVNLIHVDDCIGIIATILDRGYWDETLNACCPEHPLKRDFYGKAAEVSGLGLPSFTDDDGDYKIVDSSKLLNELDFKFKYRSPLDYLNSL